MYVALQCVDGRSDWMRACVCVCVCVLGAGGVEGGVARRRGASPARAGGGADAAGARSDRDQGSTQPREPRTAPAGPGAGL